MPLELIILKNGALDRKLSLDPGTYSIGRGPDNDITLQDKTVSAKHAKLEVDAKKATVTDQGSTNGVIIGGKRIKEKTFRKQFSFDCGAFSLQGDLSAAAKDAKPGGKSRISALPPRFVVYTVMVTLVLVAGLFFYLPLESSVESFQRREALKRGILLTRYLGEINVYPLEMKDLDQVRVVPVSAEDGVLYAYVIDDFGKILAPAQEMGRFLELPHVQDALELGELKTWRGPEGERIIFYPIMLEGKLQAAAMIGYDTKRAAATVSGSPGGKAGLIFIFMLALAFLGGWYVLRVFKRPLRDLAEEAGIALKERHNELRFKGAYKELQALVESFNRLLYLVQRSAAQQSDTRSAQQPRPAPAAEPAAQPAPEPKPEPKQKPQPEPEPEATPQQPEHLEIKQPQPHPEPQPEPQDRPEHDIASEPARPQPEPQQPEPAPELAAELAPELAPDPEPMATPPPKQEASPAGKDTPSCVIDLQRYVLLSCNQAFIDTFLQGQEPGADLHMLVAFEDPEMVNAISTLAEDPNPQASGLVPGEPGYTVRKEPAQGQEGAAEFTFILQ